MAAVARGLIADAHDPLRSALLIYEIEIIRCDRRIRGIKEMRRRIKCHGAAGDGSSIDLERASLQVHGVWSGRVQVRVNTADSGSGVSHPQVALRNARRTGFHTKKLSRDGVNRVERTRSRTL